MARRPLRHLIRWLTAVALAGTFALSGCSANRGSSATPGSAASGGSDTAAPVSPSPVTAASPSSGTPEATALAATSAWLSYDTRVDHRPNDTARRLALPWLAPQLRRGVLGFAGGAPPGAQWSDWSAHHARATVESQLGSDDHPPDVAGTAWRQVIAAVRLHGDGGWTATLRQTLFVQLRLIDGRWLVSDVRTQRD